MDAGLPGRQRWLFPWGDQYDGGRINVGDNPRFGGSTSPIKATPRDVSPFMVYNMVGNVSEFVNGWFDQGGKRYQEGKRCRLSKGCEYKMQGYWLGIGSCQLPIRRRGHRRGDGDSVACERPFRPVTGGEPP